MNPTSAVSVAFDPLLGWPVLAVLGGIGLVLVLLGLRAGARGTMWRLGSLVVVLAALSQPVADRGAAQADRRRGAGRGRRFRFDGDRRAPHRRSRRRARR